MKPLARFGIVGLGIAGIVAVASILYLRESKQAVERVIKPVELSAPDLFPAKTLVYTEMSGWDRSYARAETWWKRFETTAAWAAIQKGWKEDKLGLPPPMVEMLEKTDREFAKVEEKFGYRPTTRQFFESYGKHIAIGVLPAPKGERPRLLLATRLPDDAPKALQGYLAKATGVKPCEPPLHKGFPVYQEASAAAGLTVYYGVGRGYLFVSESLPELKDSLERLALATDGAAPKKPEGTLAGDPVLARVRPPAGKKESGVIYLRREQKLAEWMPDLAPVDQFIRNAFALAPNDEAVAFSLPDGPDGEVRCSFVTGPPKPWTKSLPSGLVYLEATVPAPRPDRAAELAAFYNKPLWKEIDAFISDPKRVKAFLDEALPPDDRPPDDIVARLPNDLRLVGDGLKEWLSTVVNVPDPRYAAASKVYSGLDGAQSLQSAVGFDLDPFTIFLIAGALDFARSNWTEWVVREEVPGALIWSLDMKRALQELRDAAPPELAQGIETIFGSIGPSLIVAGSRAILVFGPDFSKEIAGLQSGTGPSFEEDPLYVEARGQVRPGFAQVSWDRPFERIRAGYGSILSWIESMMDQGEQNEGMEVVGAAIKTLHRMISWAKPTRASLAATYHDAAKPWEAVDLIDADAEKRVPVLIPADAPARSPSLLPADTWLYFMQRIELKPSYDAVKAAFLEALPGGEERAKEFVPEGETKEILDALVQGLVRNLKGEIGFAIATPRPPAADGPPTPAALLARIPQFVAFAEFEKPVEAFHAAKKFMEMAHEALKDDLQSQLNVGMVGESRACALDFHIPAGEEPIVFSLCVVERSGFLYFTTSGEIVKRLGSAKEKDADSLSARAAKLLPEKVSSVGLFHGDTFIAQMRLYLELVAPMGPGLSLRGYVDGPPPDRVEAHQAGWVKWMDLVLDLFKTKSWVVTSTSRTGNVVRSSMAVVAEK